VSGWPGRWLSICVRRKWFILGLAALTITIAGCRPASLFSNPGTRRASPAISLTEHVPPSLLVSVVGGAVAGRSIAALIAATARPSEDVDLLQSGPPPRTLDAAQAPAPATIRVPGRPAAPGGGATSYQQAQYQKALLAWRGQLEAGQLKVATLTRAAVSRWARELRLPADVTGSDGSLAGECGLAASALVGLTQYRLDSRRVVVLYAGSLGGTLPAGELTGDNVVVITPFLPSAAAATATQAQLLGAGAARAAVLGPGSTGTQLDGLVSAGLSRQVITETLSGPVLFPNDSAVLAPGASAELMPLLAQLRQPGATGVVNGFASTPGSASRNYALSEARATAVAAFFEAHGISAFSLIVVGHGASDLVAPPAAAANRRVVVVIEQPSGSQF
jgi:outer membrane protein OmpA-like peptidoglycan-associated protein